MPSKSVPANRPAPKRPFTLFVDFAPGGGADAAALLIAKKAHRKHGSKRHCGKQSRCSREHRSPASGQRRGRWLCHFAGLYRPHDHCTANDETGLRAVKDLAPISDGVNFPNTLVVNKESDIKIQFSDSADRFVVTYLPPNAPTSRLAFLTASHR